MRITVRQLKHLIRESIAEAMVGAGEVNPRIKAKIEKIAKEQSPFLSVDAPETVLFNIATTVDHKFSLGGVDERIFAYVGMVVNAMKRHLDPQDFDALESAMPDFQEEWKEDTMATNKLG